MNRNLHVLQNNEGQLNFATKSNFTGFVPIMNTANTTITTTYGVLSDNYIKVVRRWKDANQ